MRTPTIAWIHALGAPWRISWIDQIANAAPQAARAKPTSPERNRIGRDHTPNHNRSHASTTSEETPKSCSTRPVNKKGRCGARRWQKRS